MTGFDSFHFIRPFWLLLLPLAPLLPWAWRRGRRPAGDWVRVCDPHLLRWLSLKQVDEQPRGAGPWLAATALLICILALAGKLGVAGVESVQDITKTLITNYLKGFAAN